MMHGAYNVKFIIFLLQVRIYNPTNNLSTFVLDFHQCNLKWWQYLRPNPEVPVTEFEDELFKMICRFVITVAPNFALGFLRFRNPYLSPVIGKFAGQST